MTILFFLTIGCVGLSTAKADGSTFVTTNAGLEKNQAEACSLSFPHPVAEPVELLTSSVLAKHRLPVSGLPPFPPAAMVKSRVSTIIPAEQAPGEYAVSHHLRCLYPFYAFW